MNIKAQETAQSIYLRVTKMANAAVEARNNSTDLHRRIMLAGKVKAYIDVLCLLQDRYKTKLTKRPVGPTSKVIR